MEERACREISRDCRIFGGGVGFGNCPETAVIHNAHHWGAMLAVGVGMFTAMAIVFWGAIRGDKTDTEA